MTITTCDKCRKEIEVSYPMQLMGQEWVFCILCIVEPLEFIKGYIGEKKTKVLGFVKEE